MKGYCSQPATSKSTKQLPNSTEKGRCKNPSNRFPWTPLSRPSYTATVWHAMKNGLYAGTKHFNLQCSQTFRFFYKKCNCISTSGTVTVSRAHESFSGFYWCSCVING